MSYVLGAIAVAGFFGTLALAIERWVRQRERMEERSEHIRAMDLLGQQNSQLVLTMRQESDRAMLMTRLDEMDREIKRLHDKASKEGGRQQERMGRMELLVNGFIKESQARLDELYRLQGGRRATDQRVE